MNPIWLSALGVLILNDHLLKTSGLPDVLTGKLSDFAGLIVAPVLLSVVLSSVLSIFVPIQRSSLKALRVMSVLLTGLVFALIQVSPQVAALVERLTAMTATPWTIYQDPTDLIALLVLPIAYRVSAPTTKGPSMPGQHIFERAAMVTGLLACAASSPGSAWSTASFVHNLTDEPIDLRIRWTDAALDCDALRGKTGLALDRSVFREGSTFQLDPSTTLPLERRAFQDPFAAPAPVDVPTEDDLPPKDTRCSIALISADGFDDTLIFWSQLPTLSVPPFLEDEDPNFSTDGRLTFTKEDDAMVMSPGAGLDVAPILDQIDPSSCRDSRPTRFQWTNDFPARLRTTLTDVSVGPDGCIGMVLDGVDERLYLCIPSERFLYAPGDILDVTHERLSQGRSLNIVRDATAEKRRLEITVYSGVKRFDDALVSGEVEELECGGRRLSCGAFSIPAAISLNDGGRLTAGSATEFYDSSMNANVSLHIGRAEHTLVGTDRCDTARRRAGISADILIVYEEVE